MEEQAFSKHSIKVFESFLAIFEIAEVDEVDPLLLEIIILCFG